MFVRAGEVRRERRQERREVEDGVGRYGVGVSGREVMVRVDRLFRYTAVLVVCVNVRGMSVECG
jgi:hypothetical protein